MHRVVIIGGGFGGLNAARYLRRAPVSVTLVDRRNFHLFQPLLYQVATGALSPANIAVPLRALLKRQKNATVLMAEVQSIDLTNRRVILDTGDVPFDTLIVAAGSTHSYFGHPEWSAHATGLKTIEDATLIRRQLLGAFEAAERTPPGPERDAWLTFVVVGGGPTGLELVGQIAEIARQTLRREFRSIDPAEAKIYLVEAADRVLPMYPPKLSQKAANALESLDVRTLIGARVTHVGPESVAYQQGEYTHSILARTVVWAAGVQSSPLAGALATATGTSTDRNGRIMVQPDLSMPGHPEVFVIGDMAHLKDSKGGLLPALAPVAMQQGRYVARLIRNRLAGKSMPAFHYRDLGTMATIGRFKAVADLRFIRLSGPLAWLTWLFVHLMSLVQFQNRVLVFIQWAWLFFTRNRAARLITNVIPDERQAVRHS